MRDKNAVQSVGSGSRDSSGAVVEFPQGAARRAKAKKVTEVIPSEKSDDELVAGIRSGDNLAFIEIVERYSQKALNLALRITRNQEDAEEILQDVFVTVFNKIDRFEGKSAFSSWLYRITVNTAFMKLRKRKQTPAVSLEEISPGIRETWVGKTSESSDMNYISSRHEIREVLERAVNRLPGEYKIIFILRDVDGLSNQEVGEILNLSVPAVKSRLHRSRLMLRRKLQKYYDDYVREDLISFGVGIQSRLLEAAA